MLTSENKKGGSRWEGKRTKLEQATNGERRLWEAEARRERVDTTRSTKAHQTNKNHDTTEEQGKQGESQGAEASVTRNNLL